MEALTEILNQLPSLLSNGELLPALFLVGAGCVIFLIADNGAQEFSLLNGLFVILGYLTGTVITLIGLYTVWQIIAPGTAPEIPVN